MRTGHTTVVVSHVGGMATIVKNEEVRRVMAGATRPSVAEYDWPVYGTAASSESIRSSWELSLLDIGVRGL
jgi:hypothetical protein